MKKTSTRGSPVQVLTRQSLLDFKYRLANYFSTELPVLGQKKVELNRRKLSDEERDSLEGIITKEEMTTQLFKHMKAHSAPGIDGFTVDWVRAHWDDLSDLCFMAVNACYNKGELTTMLKTAIMKLLRKGDKNKLEATNYRPISLLSVFYKIVLGDITWRLDKVINKVIGR